MLVMLVTTVPCAYDSPMGYTSVTPVKYCVLLVNTVLIVSVDHVWLAHTRLIEVLSVVLNVRWVQCHHMVLVHVLIVPLVHPHRHMHSHHVLYAHKVESHLLVSVIVVSAVLVYSPMRIDLDVGYVHQHYRRVHVVLDD